MMRLDVLLPLSSEVEQLRRTLPGIAPNYHVHHAPLSWLLPHPVVQAALRRDYAGDSQKCQSPVRGDHLGEPIDERSEYSVGELLRIRMGGDRWHLALVQRDEVWDVERMKRLLDSLLAGYPVGALLLCRTDEVASKVIDRDAAEETVREAPEGATNSLTASSV